MTHIATKFKIPNCGKMRQCGLQCHQQAQARAIDSDEKSKGDQIVEASRKKLERAISPKHSRHSQPKNVRKRNSTVSPTGSNRSSFDQLPFVQC